MVSSSNYIDSLTFLWRAPNNAHRTLNKNATNKKEMIKQKRRKNNWLTFVKIYLSCMARQYNTILYICYKSIWLMRTLHLWPWVFVCLWWLSQSHSVLDTHLHTLWACRCTVTRNVITHFVVLLRNLAGFFFSFF